MSFIVSFNVLDFIYGLIILFIIIAIITFGANVGTVMSDKWLYYKNKQLEEKIKELKKELRE